MSLEFNIYAFGEVCLSIIPMVVFISLLFSTFISALASHSSYGMQLMLILSYIFAFGVIAHELAHRLFCAIFGVKVKKMQLFKVTRKKTADQEYMSIGGYVDCEDVTSVIAALFLGFAPLIINGLLVALLVYYGSLIMNTQFYALAVYAGVSLGLGARTSKEDMLLWISSLRKNPGRGILELVCLCLFVGVLFYLGIIIQIPLWGSFSLFLVFIIVVIVYNRRKPTAFKDKFPGM